MTSDQNFWKRAFSWLLAFNLLSIVWFLASDNSLWHTLIYNYGLKGQYLWFSANLQNQVGTANFLNVPLLIFLCSTIGNLLTSVWIYSKSKSR